jgi:peptide/nickel transport system substrate-binding protein
MKLRRLLVIPLTAGALALAACGPQNQAPPGSEATSQPTAAPITAQDINPKDRAELQQGGTIRLDVSDFAGAYNNLSVNGNNADVKKTQNPLLPRYYTFDAKGTGTPDPNYLESVELTNPDPTTVHMKLNPKAVWGDGSPVDVDDWIATWKSLNGTNTKFQAASTVGYDSIANITSGADKFDVTITWKTAYPDWENVVGTGPLKAESVKDPDTFNNEWTSYKNEWFAGPFKVGSYDASQKVLTLVPNDRWWGDDKPLLDKIVFRAISPDAVAAAFANDELDTFDIGPDPDAYKRASGVQGAAIRQAAGPNFRHITFNQKAGLLTDKVVRQSIVRGLDRTAIGASDLAGIDWPVTPLNNIFLLQTQEGYVDVAKETGIDYDPEKAKADLEAAGWKAGADGMRSKDGKPLTVKFMQLAGVPVSQNEALQTQNMLKEIGIKVDIVNVPISKFQDGTLLSKGEFELLAFSWIGTPFPFQFPGQLAKTGSESNYANVSIPEVDQLITQIDKETDPQKRIDQTNQVSKILWEDVSTLPLYQRPELVAVKANLANYGAFGLSNNWFLWQNVGYQK